MKSLFPMTDPFTSSLLAGWRGESHRRRHRTVRVSVGLVCLFVCWFFGYGHTDTYTHTHTLSLSLPLSLSLSSLSSLFQAWEWAKTATRGVSMSVTRAPRAI